MNDRNRPCWLNTPRTRNPWVPYLYLAPDHCHLSWGPWTANYWRWQWAFRSGRQADATGRRPTLRWLHLGRFEFYAPSSRWSDWLHPYRPAASKQGLSA